MLRSAALLGAAALLASQTAALTFTVRDVDCLQLDWSVELNATEWSITSNVELFFSPASIGAQAYSLLYSALPNGPVPSPGTFDLTTMFGSTALNGRYAIGVELLDASGAVITPSASNNYIQSVDTDNHVYTFSNCAAEIASAVVSTTATSSSALSTSTSLSSSARLTSATVAPSSSAAQTTASPSSTASTASAAAGPPTTMSHTGAIVGGVIGGLFAVLAMFALFRFCSKRNRAATSARHQKAIVLKRRSSSNASPETSEHVLEEGGAAETDRYAASHGPRSDTSHHPWSSYSASAAPSVRSAANPFRDQENPAEIRMVQVPFQLSTPRMPGQQEVPLHRVSSTPMVTRGAPSPTVEGFAADSASESNHTAHPIASKRGDGSPPVSTFKIPRVSVPAYSSTDAEQSRARTPQTPSRNTERRPSAGHDSLVSTEDPFVDTRQATSPELRRHY